MECDKILFIDRDGTLIVEPPSEQIDTIEQIKLLPDVIPSLLILKKEGYKFVMLTNQDGLDSSSYSLESFIKVQNFLVDLFQSQGIEFQDIRVCPHFQSDNCFCRKPKPGLILDFLTEKRIDKNFSFVLGDRESDLDLADFMGIEGIKINQENAKSWPNAVITILKQSRVAKVVRTTKETTVVCEINLDQEGLVNINTGFPFMNHMLEQLVFHAGVSVNLQVEGDFHIDDHHVIEDSALVLGQTLRRSIGDKFGIARYGFVLPMDESLADIALDLSGRSLLRYQVDITREQIGGIATEMFKHFFISFADGLQATLHIKCQGENTHHMIESIFKGLGRTLRQAVNKNSTSLPTTKGVL